MLDPVKPEDSYSAKTHLHQPVPEMATVAATALPADAPEAALPSEVRPEIITWEKLVEAISPALAGKKIIAEDLGVVTPQVRRLLEKSGYPGMKLMEFAFDSDSTNENLPCHFEKNMVVYGGTHDNETLAGFFGPGQSRRMLRFARRYLDVSQNVQIPWALIRAGYASCADTVVFQLQDFLGLDNRARINTPSTLGGNWCWRLVKGQLSDDLAVKIRDLTELYGR